MVKTPRFHCRGARVRYLVKELRSCVPCGAAKKPPKTAKNTVVLTGRGHSHQLTPEPKVTFTKKTGFRGIQPCTYKVWSLRFAFFLFIKLLMQRYYHA